MSEAATPAPDAEHVAAVALALGYALRGQKLRKVLRRARADLAAFEAYATPRRGGNIVPIRPPSCSQAAALNGVRVARAAIETLLDGASR